MSAAIAPAGIEPQSRRGFVREVRRAEDLSRRALDTLRQFDQHERWDSPRNYRVLDDTLYYVNGRGRHGGGALGATQRALNAYGRISYEARDAARSAERSLWHASYDLTDHAPRGGRDIPSPRAAWDNIRSAMHNLDYAERAARRW